MKLAVLRLGFFHIAQSSQMPVERILLLCLIEVIYFIRAIYILGKGGLWQQMHFLGGSFETSFGHGFHRKSHSHSGVHLP